jgi:hypothetical protein
VDPRAGLDTEDRGKIFSPLPGTEPDRPVVQPVVRQYITPAPGLTYYESEKTVAEKRNNNLTTVLSHLRTHFIISLMTNPS